MSISNPAFRPVQDARWADLQRLQTSSPIEVPLQNGNGDIDGLCGTLRRLSDRSPLQRTPQQSVA